MSLNFGTTSSFLTFSIGNAANVSNGACTLAVLWKYNSNSGLIGAFSGASEQRGTGLDSGHLFGNNDFSNGFGTISVIGDFYWLVLTKAAGNVTYRCHVKDYTAAGAWAHGVSVGAGNHSDPGVSDNIRIGPSPADAVRGDVAVAALWTSALSDADVEAACTSALADLMAKSPTWAARFMLSAPTSIQDLTGGGGNETARSGTVTATADPVGYNFALTTPRPYDFFNFF